VEARGFAPLYRRAITEASTSVVFAFYFALQDSQRQDACRSYLDKFPLGLRELAFR
jgi:hypothetical protein